MWFDALSALLLATPPNSVHQIWNNSHKIDANDLSWMFYCINMLPLLKERERW